MKRKFGANLVLILLILLPVLAFSQDRSFILLSSTIGPIDSGIVAALEDAFEKETGIRVRHVGAGTGAALELAKKGSVDIVMAHARSLEEKFIQEGFGTERIDFMYNDFVIVGPPADPAGIRGLKKAVEALHIISEKKIPFISRGDKSGTHVAEMELWNKAMIKPQGAWYQVYEKGTEGNVPTLRYTDQKQAYTVIDRATFLSLQKEIKLQVLVENDLLLLNFISLLPVNPQKFPRVNHEGVKTFVKWLTDPGKGQKIVEEFGKDKYGSPLFFPNSKEWRETKGVKG
jgi:tungstate transport system substrate-binding protein